jgi:hypothetical protein
MPKKLSKKKSINNKRKVKHVVNKSQKLIKNVLKGGEEKLLAKDITYFEYDTEDPYNTFIKSFKQLLPIHPHNKEQRINLFILLLYRINRYAHPELFKERSKLIEFLYNLSEEAPPLPPNRKPAPQLPPSRIPAPQLPPSRIPAPQLPPSRIPAPQLPPPRRLAQSDGYVNFQLSPQNNTQPGYVNVPVNASSQQNMPFNVEGASTGSSPDNGPLDDQNAPALPPKRNRPLGPA